MGSATDTREYDEIILAGVIRESITDGPGMRLVVFVQGCPHRCRGCHNPDTHDFNGGYPVKAERIVEEIDKNPLLAGVTFSGGEPVCQARGLLPVARAVKDRGLSLGMYTGYTYEELSHMRKENPDLSRLMEMLDFLVDGPYIEEERDLTLTFRGSRNQRFIEMKDGVRIESPRSHGKTFR